MPAMAFVDGAIGPLAHARVPVTDRGFLWGDHAFEIVQSFSDDSLTQCPECGGALKKVFGNVGITFKGGGFYKTDSRSGSGSGSPSGSSSSSGASDGAPSDSSSSTPSK